MTPQELVTDANVWIDLQVANLLADVVKLRVVLVIPDIVHAEMERVRPEVYEALKRPIDLRDVLVGELDGDGVSLASDLGTTYPKPQRPDLFALAIAKTSNAILVTGDRDLRQAAETEGVEVHGTLWLLKTMVLQSVLAKPRAREALQQMRSSDRRLPERDCRRLLEEWNR